MPHILFVPGFPCGKHFHGGSAVYHMQCGNHTSNFPFNLNHNTIVNLISKQAKCDQFVDLLYSL